MLSKKMEEALNNQINNEMYSAYLYLAMATNADFLGFKGFSQWFTVQYHEEMFHAMKLHAYIKRHGGKPRLLAIKEPAAEYKTVLDMFEKTLTHEQFITKSINDLIEIAREEKDNATQIFLQWYVMEQVEEEENDNDIILRLKMLKDTMGGMVMFDKELGKRTVTVQTDFTKTSD